MADIMAALYKRQQGEVTKKWLSCYWDRGPKSMHKAELAWAGRSSGGPARPKQIGPARAQPEPERAGLLDISGPPDRAWAGPGVGIGKFGRARA